LISGTHGVEGYCGSGAQVDWLRREEFKVLPADTGVLIIHAINPYGFAWTRRVNEDNVDLNRNWVDFSEPLPPNPSYVELAENLCPSEWTAEAQEATARNMAACRRRTGAGGGRLSAGRDGRPTHSSARIILRRQRPFMVEANANSDLSKIPDARETRWRHRLSHWAGTCGYAERLTVFPLEEPEFRRAAAWFGAAVTSTKSGTAARRT